MGTALNEQSTMEDRLAVSFTRAVTRRTFLQRTMRWTLTAGAAISGALTFAPRASAARCQFTSTKWGCYCNLGTPTCGSGKCDNDYCVNGAVARCNYWTSFPYCWCSTNCCIGSHTGYFSCCDCWGGGFHDPCTPRCACGYTPCICGYRTWTGTC
jgi:hypothetical protein